ncbi:MAG TPA: GAF domain-containing protein [Gammaproteobacteria bacterium]|nr:GAF domain-containing protein [Gammaproteobacteria bacterium]
MQRRYGLLILLSLFVAALCAYSGVQTFQGAGLPFTQHLVDAHTAEITPIPGIPLPAGLQPGDQLDLVALPRASRLALGATLPPGQIYDMTVRRGGGLVTVPVTSVHMDVAADSGLNAYHWATVCFDVLLSIIVLLALWRGRDRAAAGLVLWGAAFLTGTATNLMPRYGTLGGDLLLGTTSFFLLARVGFYLVVESMVSNALTPRARVLWRAGFLLLLAAGAVQTLGGPAIFAATGWAELLLPQYGFALTASYLVPVALLFVSYRHAEPVQRLRLRWMLWSSVVFVAGIFLSNSPILGVLPSIIISSLMYFTSMACILYAVLRHRVVDVAVILDRTLVYGAMTALVVGVLAAVNSLVQHAALGTNAGLLVQIVVPFALGIVLQRVRGYADRIVEQLFFRRRYLAEKALRTFARRCGQIADPEHLLDAVIEALHTHLGTPGVALYERRGAGYTCLRQAGKPIYPDIVGLDDPAMVAARAGEKAVDLAELSSGLGAEGYLFPLTAGGKTLGALICAHRPGEHYALDERKLIAKLARQVGLAWQGVLARESHAFVRAVARGSLKPETARKRALKLEENWTAS